MAQSKSAAGRLQARLQGVAVGRWALRAGAGPVAFYDIDTPVTLAKLARGDFEYLTPELIAD